MLKVELFASLCVLLFDPRSLIESMRTKGGGSEKEGSEKSEEYSNVEGGKKRLDV